MNSILSDKISYIMLFYKPFNLWSKLSDFICVVKVDFSFFNLVFWNFDFYFDFGIFIKQLLMSVSWTFCLCLYKIQVKANSRCFTGVKTPKSCILLRFLSHIHLGNVTFLMRENEGYFIIQNFIKKNVRFLNCVAMF